MLNSTFSNKCSEVASNSNNNNNNNFVEQTIGEDKPMPVSRMRTITQGIIASSNIYAPGIVSCSSYLCPDTLVCVSTPAECPCPHVEDVKCLVPDAVERGAATVVCARGDGCGDVLSQMNKKWN
jgi:hypothetical protein